MDSLLVFDDEDNKWVKISLVLMFVEEIVFLEKLASSFSNKIFIESKVPFNSINLRIICLSLVKRGKIVSELLLYIEMKECEDIL
jgi:hypothetical protein